ASLNAAADFPGHKLKADKTPELEHIQKFVLYSLPLERLAIQKHFFVHKFATRSKERHAQLDPVIVVGPAAARISFGDLSGFRADIADQFFVSVKPHDRAAE